MAAKLMTGGKDKKKGGHRRLYTRQMREKGRGRPWCGRGVWVSMGKIQNRPSRAAYAWAPASMARQSLPVAMMTGSIPFITPYFFKKNSL